MTTTRRKFLTHGALAAGATTLAAPAVAQGAPIKWRMQTYAGTSLGAHVAKPAIDSFNKIAQGQMEIELYYADQLVPTPNCSGPCSGAPSTRCSPTTTAWPPRPR